MCSPRPTVPGSNSPSAGGLGQPRVQAHGWDGIEADLTPKLLRENAARCFRLADKGLAWASLCQRTFLSGTGSDRRAVRSSAASPIRVCTLDLTASAEGLFFTDDSLRPSGEPVGAVSPLGRGWIVAICDTSWLGALDLTDNA